MKGTEKQIAWANEIIKTAVSDIEAHLQKKRDQLAKQNAKKLANPDRVFSIDYADQLAEDQFYADHLVTAFEKIESAAIVIDMRASFEKLSNGVDQFSTNNILHYVCGVSAERLPKF